MFSRYERLQPAVQQDGDGGFDVGDQDGAGGQGISGVGVSQEHARRRGVHQQGRILCVVVVAAVAEWVEHWPTNQTTRVQFMVNKSDF